MKLPPPNFYEQLAKFVEPYSDIEERRYSSLAGEWPKYVNKHFGFSFHYPFEGQLVEETENRVIIGFDRVERTNLSEKRITVTCVEGDDCSGYLTEKQDPLEGIQSNHTINGRSFIVVSRQGAAMSKYYDVTTYSTRLGKACITIELHLRFVSSGPFWPHLITQVDLESEKEIIRYVAAAFAVE